MCRVCLCVSLEWTASSKFVAGVLHVLAKRIGVDGFFAETDDLETISTLVNGLDDEVARALTAGVVFVICGEIEAADTDENYAKLATLLKPKSQQVIRADELGAPVDEEQATQALNDLSDFLNVHRLSDQHVDKAGLLRDAIDNKNAIAGVLSDQYAQQVATHVASLVKIVTAQLQQSFVFLRFPFDWTPFLVALKEQIGKWVLVDIPVIMNTGCLLGGGTSAVLLPGVMSSLLLVVLLSCCCLKSARNRNKWIHHGDEEAAARAGHSANFAWALYTLMSPLAVANLIQMTDSNDAIAAAVAALLALPLVLLVPSFAFCQLRRGAKAGILHSRAFEARYGWLCARCAGAHRVVCQTMEALPAKPSQFHLVSCMACCAAHGRL